MYIVLAQIANGRDHGALGKIKFDCTVCAELARFLKERGGREWRE